MTKTEEFGTDTPGSKTRWLQGFVAILSQEFRHTIFGIACGSGALGILVAFNVISLRSAIMGTAATIIFWLINFSRQSLRVSHNPFAIYDYKEWVKNQQTQSIDPLKQDWYHWFRKMQPQYKYRTPPKRIAAYSK